MNNWNKVRDFEYEVHTWFIQRSLDQSDICLRIANDMMHIAFTEQDVQRNPCLCYQPTGVTMDYLLQLFANTSDRHREIVFDSRISLQTINGCPIRFETFLNFVHDAMYMFEERSMLSAEGMILLSRLAVRFYKLGLESAAIIGIGVIYRRISFDNFPITRGYYNETT